MISYFITGTDTDIGKTFVTGGLALSCVKKGYKTGVFKPLQSGAIETAQGPLAPDIEAVKKLSNKIKCKYSYLLAGEVSPALAANLAGIKIYADKIKEDFINFGKNLDITFVEGAGGLCAPAAENLLMCDLIKLLNIPAILVTGAYLGSINHTLLSIKLLQSQNIPIKGIIINNYPSKTNDIAILNFEKELKSFTDTEILGIIEKQKTITKEKLIKIFENSANRLIS